MSNYPDNPVPLPVLKLCNKVSPPNPILGDGPLGGAYNKDAEIIKHLQLMLVTLGYDLGKTGENNDGVDGDFGNLTRKAVEDFQRKNMDWEGKPLDADGLVGPETADALNRRLVGVWYDVYETPKEITKDTLHITATEDALKRGISLYPKDTLHVTDRNTLKRNGLLSSDDVKKAKVVLVSSSIATVVNPVAKHLWQEFHKDAENKDDPKIDFGTDDDKKVVKNPDAAGNLQSKKKLHLCFLEKAIAIIQIDVKEDAYYAKWEIIDKDDKVVHKHPSFTEANYKDKKPAALLKTGWYGWLWDGRNNQTTLRVFCPAGTYYSRITIKDAADKEQVLKEEIRLEGDPYKIFIVGHPKTDNELRAEFSRPALNNRFLDSNGERTARDCCIIVHRGEENEGHVAFLGQGTEEATKADGSPNFGAIATPHSREFKGWIRPNPHNVPIKPDRVQIEHLNRTDQLIQLFNIGGPPPNNPYCDSNPNTPYKDGVQAHRGNAKWTTNGLSVGCTTVSPITGATAANPGSVWGRVRSLDSEFGNWGNPNLGENVAVAGPNFVNKQTKRNRTADALIADDHVAPELNPPQHPAPATGAPGRDEPPLHMQPTMQKAVFGGFHGYEIPIDSNVKDEPDNMLRIRMELREYDNMPMYYQYHHAVIFGHTWRRDGNRYNITAWIPRKVIRRWNGNRRNLLIHGHCWIAWYIERRSRGSSPEIMNGSPSYAALTNTDIGRVERTWTPPARLDSGEYFSVFDYRVEVLPYVAGADEWVTEERSTDLFSGILQQGWAGRSASILKEEIVTDGNSQYIAGTNELLITTI